MFISLAVICQMGLSVKSLNLMPTVDPEIPPIDRSHMAKGFDKKATFWTCILSEVSKLFWMIFCRNLKINFLHWTLKIPLPFYSNYRILQISFFLPSNTMPTAYSCRIVFFLFFSPFSPIFYCFFQALRKGFSRVSMIQISKSKQ